jgi:hypothetical protein
MPNTAHNNGPTDEQLEKTGYWVAILCTTALGPTGLQLFIQILPDYGKLSTDAWKAMFQVFVLSAPLVIAVAVTTVAVIRNWLSINNPDWRTGAVCVFWIFALFLSNVGVGMGPVVMQDVVKGGHPLARVVVNIGAGYFKTYGSFLFISAVALGIWLAFATNKYMAKHLEELDS